MRCSPKINRGHSLLSRVSQKHPILIYLMKMPDLITAAQKPTRLSKEYPAYFSSLSQCGYRAFYSLERVTSGQAW